MSCYQFIDQQRTSYPVRLLCRVLEVAPAHYYAWRKAATSAPAASAPPAWEEALEKAFTRHQKRYGTRRLRVELQEKGHRVDRQRLRTAMRQRGLRALQPRAFTPRTTDSTHTLRCAPNRLLDQPAPMRPNQVWVSDITYLPLASGEWALFRTALPARWWAGK
ncbi:MAG: IS3 family transposase [Janthinobacterium lividum]